MHRHHKLLARHRYHLNKVVSAGDWHAGRFRGDKNGGTAMMFGITLPVLIGFAGLSVEVGSWYLEKRELQEAADSAAVAGAYEYRNDPDVSQGAINTAVSAAVAKSGFGSATQSVYHPPQTGMFAPGAAYEHPGAVEVVVTENYDTLFVSLFGLNSVDISARAVAVESPNEASACIIALERCLPSDAGVVFQGSLDLDLVDCTVHSNDACYEGADFNGNPDVQADCLSVGGSVSGSSSGLALLCGNPQPIAPPVDDPFSDVVVPDVTAEPCQDANGTTVGSTRTFSPGRYCGDMNFTNDNVFESGLYIVEGDFFENGGTMTGDDVILVYSNSDSEFDFRGNGDLDIGAPSADIIKDNNGSSPLDNNGDGIADNAFELISDTEADDWAGLLVYNMSTVGVGDINNCDNKINGNSGISAVGAFYFPNTCIVFTGNNKTASNGECLTIVAGNVVLSGNAGLDSTGCDPSFNVATYPHVVGLVE